MQLNSHLVETVEYHLKERDGDVARTGVKSVAAFVQNVSCPNTKNATHVLNLQFLEGNFLSHICLNPILKIFSPTLERLKASQNISYGYCLLLVNFQFNLKIFLFQLILPALK